MRGTLEETVVYRDILRASLDLHAVPGRDISVVMEAAIDDPPAMAAPPSRLELAHCSKRQPSTVKSSTPASLADPRRIV
ncbi:MAG: hypothetical protein R2724_23605 [Bryobacterales bacterium]